jgi:hypothetical protein
MAYTDTQLADFLSKCRAANCEKDEAAPGASQPNLKCTPKTLSAEQMEHIEEVIRQQRIECEKGSWRASAKWLEENCEEFREPPNGKVSTATNGTGSSTNCPNSVASEGKLNNLINLKPTNELTIESQCLRSAPESPQSAREALPAQSPIPLASAFWQALLFGNPDSLVPSSDATRALQLVSDKLGVRTVDGETISTMRAGQLRKLLRDRFGPADAEQTTAALWRAAPASPDAPIPHEDQSHCSSGVKDCPRSMPAWRREFHQEFSNVQRLLESIGGWPGAF